MTYLAIPMIAIVAGVVAAIVAITRSTRVAIVLGAWLAITGVLALTGALRLTGGPPRVLVLPVLAIAGTLLVLRSPAGKRLVAAAPLEMVIALQAFRVAVELVLWRLHAAGAIPVQMTFEGRNFDILVGLTAIPMALLVRRHPRLAVGWHLASLALLANIVAIAVAAATGTDAANRIIGTFPFVWLPAVLVPIAALGHVVGLRQLAIARHAARGAGTSPACEPDPSSSASPRSRHA